MFTTMDGGIGLCPSRTRVGDLVVLLFGGRVPYLLRPRVVTSVEGGRESVGSKEYHFVGECYFESSMNGKICSSMSDSDIEVFLLA
jgi:hypothetical protein